MQHSDVYILTYYYISLGLLEFNACIMWEMIISRPPENSFYSYRAESCERNRPQVLGPVMESLGFSLVTIPCHTILFTAKAEQKLGSPLAAILFPVLSHL